MSMRESGIELENGFVIRVAYEHITSSFGQKDSSPPQSFLILPTKDINIVLAETLIVRKRGIRWVEVYKVPWPGFG